ncbi:MAG: tRNA (N6-threonylcarbamoyladenosine(37)-N6)-methyltransferase TrmO [candidate division WOR-3 bacterium]|nr:tRNA (N6-threonylcarbamoyladenosine(37)-N6)-methyltransferase TrmO [candidate division WOR-3 bacterium]
MNFQPIGVLHSEHRVAAQTPIQPVYAKGCRGRAEVFPEFAEGLTDLEGFSHVYVIYHFHQAPTPKLKVKPFLQDVERGVFATRAPARPNPIGISIVELIRREGNVLYLDGVDVLDGTPLLDIKPYVPRFDRTETTRNGWQDEIDEKEAQKRGRREDPGNTAG